MRGLSSPIQDMLRVHHSANIKEFREASDRVFVLARQVARSKGSSWLTFERSQLKAAIIKAGKGLDTLRFRHVLGLALAMARRGQMPSHVIEETVSWPSDWRHFQICLDLALRLIEQRGVTEKVVTTIWRIGSASAEPAEVGNQCACLADLVLSTDILQSRSWESDLKHCAQSLSPARLRAAVTGASRQRDVHGFLIAISAFKANYSDAQFYAVVDWLCDLAQEGHGVSGFERFPPAIAALTWNAFSIALNVSRDLTTKGVPPATVVEQVLAPAVNASTTPDDFATNVGALYELAAETPKSPDRLQRLSALPKAGFSSKRFLRCVELFNSTEGIRPDALRAGVDAASSASSSDQEFDSNMSVLQSLLAAVGDDDADGSRRSGCLLALPQVGMSSRRFQGSAAIVGRLCDGSLNARAAALRGSLEAASKLALAEDQFDTNAAAIDRFFSRAQSDFASTPIGLPDLHLPTTLPHTERFHQGFDAAAALLAIRPRVSEVFEGIWAAALSLDDFERRLGVLERIATALEKQKVAVGVSPGIGPLLDQVKHVLDSYDDFELVLHPALTSEQTDYDSYYGTSSSYTVTDRPEWIEVRPTGRRTSPLALALVDLPALQARLETRSWLWQHAVGRVERERALERCATLRSFLYTVLERLMRSGLLGVDRRVESVFVIGSYPWVAQPRDVDLFIVVSGEKDVIERPASLVSEQGVHLTELVAPLAIEVVGRATLDAVARGLRAQHSRELTQRLALLYGSPLLAGQDLEESVKPSDDVLRQMAAGLRENAKRHTGPKQQWREVEARALESFLKAREKSDKRK